MVVFGNKKKLEGQGLTLYGQQLERVRFFEFLGVHFEEGMMWMVHVEKTVEKWEKVINVLRCITGSDWGADRETLSMIYQALVDQS